MFKMRKVLKKRPINLKKRRSGKEEEKEGKK